MTETLRRGDRVLFWFDGRELTGTIVDRNFCGCWIVEDSTGIQYEATSEELRIA